MTDSEEPPADATARTRDTTRMRSRRARRGRRPVRPLTRTPMTIADAAGWFVADLLEVSGYVRPSMRHRSGYSHYRPVLTAPDPWYFAGLVALEGCKILDYFPKEKADALMREVLVQADAASAKHEVQVSDLVLGIMGRLGMGALLLQAKVPDILIAKVMRLLLGSPRSAARLIPGHTAHEQVTSALKLGPPVWWRMFVRRYDVRLPGEVDEEESPLRPIAEPVEDTPVTTDTEAGDAA